MDRPLEKLIPHRPPMVLLDEVVTVDASALKLVARFTVRRENIFCMSDGLPNRVALELMAQACAALSGALDVAQHSDCAPTPGYLIGSRHMTLTCPFFEMGKTYLVTAQNILSDGVSAAFECAISDEQNTCVACATLNAYRPQVSD